MWFLLALYILYIIYIIYIEQKMNYRITDIFKDSIKNIKKHKKSIIIIFLIILLVCWIIYLVYYKITDNFETSTTTHTPIPTPINLLSKYGNDFTKFLNLIKTFKQEYNIEMMISMYIPDIPLIPGDIIKVPIYTVSDYRLSSVMFRFLELEIFFSNSSFETNLMANDVEIINSSNHYFVTNILTCNILNDVSKDPNTEPQLFGYLVLTISSNIDNNKFKNLRDCDILIWAEYAANANKKLVNISPNDSETDNYPTTSNKLSIYRYKYANILGISVYSELLDVIKTLDWNSPDTMNNIILKIDRYGNTIPTNPITTKQSIYKDDLNNFLSSMKTYKKSKVIETLLCMYIPDISINPGDIVKIPIYSLSDYRIKSLSLLLIRTPQFFTYDIIKFEFNKKPEELESSNFITFENITMCRLTIFSDMDNVEGEPQLYGKLVLTISSDITKYNITKLRQCKILMTVATALDAQNNMNKIRPASENAGYPASDNHVSMNIYDDIIKDSIPDTLFKSIYKVGLQSPIINDIISNDVGYPTPTPTSTSTSTTTPIPTSTPTSTSTSTPTPTNDTVDMLFPNFNNIFPVPQSYYERGLLPSCDIVIYLPDIEVKGGDMISLPIYCKSYYSIFKYSFYIKKLPFFDYSTTSNIYIEPQNNNNNITQDKYFYKINVTLVDEYSFKSDTINKTNTREELSDYISPYISLNDIPKRTLQGPQLLGHLKLKFVNNLNDITISTRDHGFNRLRDFDIIVLFANAVDTNNIYNNMIGLQQVSLYTDIISNGNISSSGNILILPPQICDDTGLITIPRLNLCDPKNSDMTSKFQILIDYLWDTNGKYKSHNIRNYYPFPSERIDTVGDLFPNYNNDISIQLFDVILYIPDILVKGGDIVQLSLYAKTEYSLYSIQFSLCNKLQFIDYSYENNISFYDSKIGQKIFSTDLPKGNARTFILEYPMYPYGNPHESDEYNGVYWLDKGKKRLMTPEDAAILLSLQPPAPRSTGPLFICNINLKLVNNLDDYVVSKRLRNFPFILAENFITDIHIQDKRWTNYADGSQISIYNDSIVKPYSSVYDDLLFKENYFTEYFSKNHLINSKDSLLIKKPHIIQKVPWTLLPTPTPTTTRQPTPTPTPTPTTTRQPTSQPPPTPTTTRQPTSQPPPTPTTRQPTSQPQPPPTPTTRQPTSQPPPTPTTRQPTTTKSLAYYSETDGQAYYKQLSDFNDYIVKNQNNLVNILATIQNAKEETKTNNKVLTNSITNLYNKQYLEFTNKINAVVNNKYNQSKFLSF
jgi:hypothetical protein